MIINNDVLQIRP